MRERLNWLFIIPLFWALPRFAIAQQDTLTEVSALEKNRFKPAVLEDQSIRLRNQEGTFGRKMWFGTLPILAFEAVGYGILAALPPEISQWEKGDFNRFTYNYKSTFTQPPVFDHDKWYINYIGHPYQGALFYNSVRSQNAKIWQSSLFCLAHVAVFEYVIEGGAEQPSIQDLIVTPITGILLGEGIHRATMAMAKNGFTWYEATTVVILNPMFAINNGFKFAKPKITE